MKYLFTLPIGDWSRDGHGVCDYYHVESNKPVEEVREAHFKIKEVTGIDIHTIANEYGEPFIPQDHPVIPYLKSIGKLDKLTESYGDEDYSIYPDGMAELWAILLMAADPELELALKVEGQIPMLPFYGYDEKKRHIRFVGYGTQDI